MLGLSAACCSCSSSLDSDELVLVDPGRDDSLFASESAPSAEPLTRAECLLARFVEGESFTVVVASVVKVSVGSVMLIVGVVSIASGEPEAWFTVERGISLFRLAVLLELDNEGDDILEQIYLAAIWLIGSVAVVLVVVMVSQ